MTGKTLDEYQNEVADWGEATFPASDFASVRSHLTEEVLELYGFDKTQIAALLSVIAAMNPNKAQWPSDLRQELVDVQLLVFHAVRKMKPMRLSEGVDAKMAINRARTWNLVAEPAGHFKHVEVG